MSANTPDAAPSPGAQHIIRLSLLIGVLSFGAIAWYLRSAGTVPDANESANLLGILFFAVVGGSAGAIFFIRQKRMNATTPREKATMNIVGWALAEGAALLGAIILLLTGNVLPFVIGAVYMLASFALFPIETDSPIK